MSRTIRRKGEKKRHKSGRSNFIDLYIYDHVDEWEGRDGPVTALRGLPERKLEGHEYNKQYHKFHGDTKPGYGWGNGTYTRFRFEQRCRMKNKQEIARFMKDPEYDVVAHQPGCLSWED